MDIVGCVNGFTIWPISGSDRLRHAMGKKLQGIPTSWNWYYKSSASEEKFTDLFKMILLLNSYITDTALEKLRQKNVMVKNY